MLRSDYTDASTGLPLARWRLHRRSAAPRSLLSKCHHRPVDSYRSGPSNPPPMRRPPYGTVCHTHCSRRPAPGPIDPPQRGDPFAGLALPCLAKRSAPESAVLGDAARPSGTLELGTGRALDAPASTSNAKLAEDPSCRVPAIVSAARRCLAAWAIRGWSSPAQPQRERPSREVRAAFQADQLQGPWSPIGSTTMWEGIASANSPGRSGATDGPNQWVPAGNLSKLQRVASGPMATPRCLDRVAAGSFDRRQAPSCSRKHPSRRPPPEPRHNLNARTGSASQFPGFPHIDGGP
jgi:hypothetical protein